MLLVWNCFTANSRSVRNNESDFNAGICREKKNRHYFLQYPDKLDPIKFLENRAYLWVHMYVLYFMLKKNPTFFCLFMSSNFWLQIPCYTFSNSLKDVSAWWMLPVIGAWTHRLPSKGRSATSPCRLAFLLTAAAKWGRFLTWLSDMT